MSENSVAAQIATVPNGDIKHLTIEHPTGSTTIEASIEADGAIGATAIVRTARKLFDGDVFV